ncbi:ABC transporter ATP-binding protein [Rathayibacter iranicus]|uniref:ABC transporter ATP-binding protein n=2 Tax=Rathayibacter iranicus TaxID=59737 RepID=A0AAD1AH37_9MICO|nr:ABC transporter ATP-binding protein [Rathayibacter iranicus]AZZ56514.1 ABC transporter ATP-binding protein [Rathayibacter iranicus]MWV31944.1 ATP-binding cassette domain-containing protein [Rathayibacter iranicus NCPPB 2253 = VKM Ac-1602]PPI43783.1 ABC transporter ATP-binding protein [Rathayibacter iranicus]PPI58900.1 ABC transporter ATP-binding protein [Rathayibacter iranicus]PPI70000.1 ABC transporter ATP-binding protein [Rathayibacter iranicus]
MIDTSPVLTARSLVKRYETSTPLTDADLTLHSGESVAVLGPSGSGKTTLLHILAGILVPDSGSVTLTGGLDLARLDSPRRAQVRREKFGFVFQHGALLPELTALENVALPLMLLGRSRRDAQTRADRLFAPLGLDGLQGQRIGQLSGGQGQRVAIARAQITEAPVVFADEPTGALDGRTAHSVLDLLLTATTSRGAALVVVTHDPAIARRCSRAVEIAGGVVRAATA